MQAEAPERREALARRVDALLASDYPGLEALSNAEFKKNTTDAINQQFAFFNAIVAIAVLVGGLGIVNTLTMSVLERTRVRSACCARSGRPAGGFAARWPTSLPGLARWNALRGFLPGC